MEEILFAVSVDCLREQQTSPETTNLFDDVCAVYKAILERTGNDYLIFYNVKGLVKFL